MKYKSTNQYEFSRFISCIFAATLYMSATTPVLNAQDLYEPTALMLTWQYDPTTTMTIDWHTEPDHEADWTIYYKPVGSDEWQEAISFPHFFPYSDRVIHRVELTGLEQDTDYRFRVGEFERAYKFRTMPAELNGNRPLRFAIGGDTDSWIGYQGHPDGRVSFAMGDSHEGGNFYTMNKAVMEYDLDFVAWGGDLAYADGGRAPDRLPGRWYGWFDVIKHSLITEEGRVIPVIAAIGNHEVKRHVRSIWPKEETDAWRLANAPKYYHLFAFPGLPGYDVLDFGNYLSLFALDSGHTNEFGGTQRDWLEKELRERQRRNVDYIYPFYHTPGYPSVRSYGGSSAVSVRELWIPLFEKYGVEVAFENHDHAYKRTHPIRNEEISEDGIVYIGDGNWGKTPRDVHHVDETWYLALAESVIHGIIVTLDGSSQDFLVIDKEGEIVDEYRIPH